MLEATSPRIAGRAARAGLDDGSGCVLRMSPSRSTESRAWWKSCQICARRSTGCMTRLASMLNATSSPTREVAVDHEPRAKVKDGGGDELAHELDHLARHVAEVRDTKARAHVAGKLFLPAPLHLRLDRHRLQGLDAGDALDEERLVFGAAREISRPAARKSGVDRRRNRDIEGEGAEHDPGQQRRVDRTSRARKTTVKRRSTTSVSAEPVRKLRMFSSSRTRATESPTRRASK